MVGRRPVRDGDAVERDHAGRHHRPGLPRRHEVRAVLLRAADRHADPVGDGRAVFLSRWRLHRVRVPRTPLRREDPHAHERAVSPLARPAVRRHHRRARRHPLHHPGVEPDAHRAGHRPAHRLVHGGRRRAGRDVDRRQADGRDRRRRSGGRRHAHRRPARDGDGEPCADRGGRHRPAHQPRLHVQPDRHLHVLVRDDRRHLPDAVCTSAATRARCSATSLPNRWGRAGSH